VSNYTKKTVLVKRISASKAWTSVHGQILPYPHKEKDVADCLHNHYTALSGVVQVDRIFGGTTVEVKERKRWLRWRTLILGTVAAVVLIAAVFVLIRWRSNVALAKELRAEIEVWLQTIPKIPDSENGMLPVLSGVEAFKDGLPKRLNAEDFSVENESDKTLLRECLAEREEALAQIYKGLTYKKFMFPDDYGKGYSQKTPSMLQFHNAYRLLLLKGSLLESEGRKSKALNEYLNILRLGETLSNERSIISRMIEVGVVNEAFKPLTRILSERSVGEKEIESTLEEIIQLHGKRSNLFTAGEADYYSALILVADVTEGKIDFCEAMYGRASKGHFWRRVSTSRYVHNYGDDVQTYRRVLEMWRRIDPAKYYALPPEAKSDEARLEAAGIPLRGRFVPITIFFLPLHSNSLEIFAVTETLWRGTILLSAIRLFEARNGRLPKNLKDLGNLVPEEFLTDPFSGKEIIYRLAGNDFYLYSVGLDGVDQNAASGVPYFKEKAGLYDLQDIIFHAPPPSPKKE
jgi:hypothetical protein